MIDEPVFIFLFMPLVLLCVAVFRRMRPDAVPLVLLVASIGVYVFFFPEESTVILMSVALNLTALWLLEKEGRYRQFLLLAAAFANLAILGSYKYLVENTLPFGLSFVTFLNISALYDARKRGVSGGNVVHNGLYSLQFASIMSGPLTRFRDLQPQIATLGTRRVSAEDTFKGISLFVFGLSKAMLLGVSLDGIVRSIVQAAGDGAQIYFLEAWCAVWVGLLTIYFQFSGFSDMALALGILIGLKLTPNFNSPLKARAPADFWNRWHMSLTLWVRVYIFMPLVKLTSRLFAQGSKVAGVASWAFATMVSFIFIGAWHGSTMAYLYWGVLCGAILIASQLPSALGMRRKILPPSALSQCILLVVLMVPSLIFFSQDLDTLRAFYPALIDPGHSSVSPRLQGVVPEVFALEGFLPHAGIGTGEALLLIGVASYAALFTPNSLEIFSLIETQKAPAMRWRPTPLWGALTGLLLAACMPFVFVPIEHGFVYDEF